MKSFSQQPLSHNTKICLKLVGQLLEYSNSSTVLDGSKYASKRAFMEGYFLAIAIAQAPETFGNATNAFILGKEYTSVLKLNMTK